MSFDTTGGPSQLETNQSGAPPNMRLFAPGPDGLPFTKEVRAQVDYRRRVLGGVLLFDIVLSGGGVPNPSELYPPKDVDGTEALIQAIYQSRLDGRKRDGLVYYLLKSYLNGREKDFAEARQLPMPFVMLSDAYWCLDAGHDLEHAISLLADRRLSRAHTSKVMQAIAASTSTSAPLVLKYVFTVQPTLVEPSDIHVYAIALAEGVGFQSAWDYQRQFTESQDHREKLVVRLFDWMLIPRPRREALDTLVATPLNHYEETLLRTYALFPHDEIPSLSVSALQYLVVARAIRAGSYFEAARLDRRFTVRDSEQEGAAFERQQLVQCVLNALPVVQKVLIKEELAKEERGERKGKDDERDAKISSKFLEKFRPTTLLPSYKETQARAKSPPKGVQAAPAATGESDKLATSVDNQATRSAPTSGSGNQTSNAFYQATVSQTALQGSKMSSADVRPTADSASTQQASTSAPILTSVRAPAPATVEEDVEMADEEDLLESANRRRFGSLPPQESQEEREEVVPEINTPIFVQGQQAGDVSKSSARRSSSRPMTIPGQLHEEPSDKEEDLVKDPQEERRADDRRRNTPPGFEAPSPKRSRLSEEGDENRFRRSVPGAFETESQESIGKTDSTPEDEKRDQVPPLPHETPGPKRSTRRGRGASVDDGRAPRRSSRLSSPSHTQQGKAAKPSATPTAKTVRSRRR